MSYCVVAVKNIIRLVYTDVDFDFSVEFCRIGWVLVSPKF